MHILTAAHLVVGFWTLCLRLTYVNHVVFVQSHPHVKIHTRKPYKYVSGVKNNAAHFFL